MKKPKPLSYQMVRKDYMDELNASLGQDAFGSFVDIGQFHFGLEGAKKLHLWLDRAIRFMEKQRTCKEILKPKRRVLTPGEELHREAVALACSYKGDTK